MAWTPLTFGKHKQKTLPQVLFSDPDWFFWAFEEGAFKKRGKLNDEAIEINNKATSIRVIQKGSEKLVAEYAIHPPTKKFAFMEIVPESRPKHVGSSPTWRYNVIDLSVPREIAPYDKLGCKLLIGDVKQHLLGSSGYKMTKKRCEEFFDNDDNFEL